MDFKGMAALVTGGASGLGVATARALASSGAHVTVLDRDAARATAVAAEIGGIAAIADVADEGQVAAALAAGAEKHGVARIVVNCAGIGTPQRVLGRSGPMPLADFERIIRVNLIGTFNVIRLSAAAMAAADPIDESGERGVVISTASVAAYEGQIGQAAYAASKGGIVALTLPIARELAQFGIRVLTIAPGIFETPLLGELSSEAQAALDAAIPFPKRLGRPEEFAALVVSCCENGYLNGETIRLDGALRMAPR